LTLAGRNDYVVSMLPPFTEGGVLPPGQHVATWEEVSARFGSTRRRRRLLDGLLRATTSLRAGGAIWVWLDGSFVTAKPDPEDFDGVWDPSMVDLDKVDPLLIDPDDMQNGRLKQKAKYGGELLAGIEGGSGLPFQQFFQQGPDGEVKGIVRLDLRTLP